MIRTSRLIAAARYSLIAGFSTLAIVAAAWLSVPPLHQASAQYADIGTWGGVSTGSANAQAITIANLSANKPGIVLRFVPGAGLTNTGPTQINVSGIGLVNVLRPSSIGLVAFSGGEFQAGVMTCISYNNVASAYQLECNVDPTPIGHSVDLRQTSTTPPPGYLMENGACVSQTTYAALFSVISTTYGSCSAGQFALPNSQGTMSAAADNGRGLITTVTCSTPSTIGTQCGSQTETLTAAQLPANIPNTAASVVNSGTSVYAGTSIVQENGSGGGTVADTPVSISVATTVAINTSGGAAHPILPPILIDLKAVKF